MRNNSTKLEISFSQLNEAIDDASKKYRTELAERMFRSIVAKSPVMTGSYVCSHRIGVGSPDNTIVYKKPFNRTLLRRFVDWVLRRPTEVKSHAYMEAQRKQALKQLSRLKRAGPFTPIFISNSIPHALDVEYLGWARTPPYHVYGLTYEEYLLKERRIMKEIELGLQAKIEGL